MAVTMQRTVLANAPLLINHYQPSGGDEAFFIAPYDLTIKEVRYVHGTAEGGASTVQIERLQGTEDVTAGDDLLSTALDGNGTANTVQTGNLVGTAVTTLSAGDRLAVYYSASTTVAEVAISIVAEKA